jgi:hypothetical protein
LTDFVQQHPQAAMIEGGLGLGVTLGIPAVGAIGSIATGGAVAGIEAALPEALTLGGNAETGIDVYLGIRNGQAVYCGITCNLAQRFAQHGSRFDALEQVTTSGVTRGDARAIEQAMIESNPGFQNIRNSISPQQPWYQDALNWGTSWLKSNGH